MLQNLEARREILSFSLWKPENAKCGLWVFFNQIADENVGVIFTKNPHFRQTLSNQLCVLLELHEPILSRVGWVFAVCEIPVIFADTINFIAGLFC